MQHLLGEVMYSLVIFAQSYSEEHSHNDIVTVTLYCIQYVRTFMLPVAYKALVIYLHSLQHKLHYFRTAKIKVSILVKVVEHY